MLGWGRRRSRELPAAQPVTVAAKRMRRFVDFRFLLPAALDWRSLDSEDRRVRPEHGRVAETICSCLTFASSCRKELSRVVTTKKVQPPKTASRFHIPQLIQRNASWASVLRPTPVNCFRRPPTVQTNHVHVPRTRNNIVWVLSFPNDSLQVLLKMCLGEALPAHY